MKRAFLIATVAAAFAAAAPLAMANDALKGKWLGTIGSSSLQMMIEGGKDGALTGTISSTSFSYKLGAEKPAAGIAQMSVRGETVTIKAVDGTFDLQLQGRMLKGRYFPATERARPRDVSLTRE
jgi:hypothetical protein